MLAHGAICEFALAECETSAVLPSIGFAQANLIGVEFTTQVQGVERAVNLTGTEPAVQRQGTERIVGLVGTEAIAQIKGS
jgi:hypothetical protein